MRRRRPRWQGPADDWPDPDFDEIEDLLSDLEDVPSPGAPAHPRPGESRSIDWSQRRQVLNRAIQAPAGAASWPADQQILYLVDVPATAQTDGLVLDVMSRQPRQDGAWRAPRPAKI